MAEYFFDLLTDDVLAVDEESTEVPDVEAAHAERQ
jgi:hypothetical protein